MRYCLFIWLILTASFTQAQTIPCGGKVLSSGGQALPNVNILAKPQSDKLPISFAITNEKGDYNFKLTTGESYELSISYLGYETQTAMIAISKTPMIRHFRLSESANQLNEVVVSATIPIIVKEDTLIYNTGAFANGEERKLRELLQKLPGVEVSPDGIVKVRGKQVNKVMIEGRSVFNGTQMAVDNIPAAVVNQIEVLSNYDNVSYLKGLEDNDITAMNIRLKENKKGFAFGNLESAGDFKERYAIQPNVFYYRPSTQINAIVDYNNMGIKSFNMADYLSFEGGFKTQTDFNSPNDELTNFLTERNYASNTQQFAAVSFQQSLTDKTNLNSYLIMSNNNTFSRSEMRNEFPDFQEQRDIENNLKSRFLTGKINIEHRPSADANLSLNSIITLSGDNAYREIISGQQINTKDELKGITLKEAVNYSRKLSQKHTAVLDAIFQYREDNPENRLQSNETLLSSFVPLLPDSLYVIQRNKRMRSIGGTIQVKDYWLLHAAHHIYLSAGVNINKNTFYSTEEQLLSNGDRHSFSEYGFGNDLRYTQSDLYAGLEYKFRTGIFTIKPAAFYHHYRWLNVAKSVVLPALLLKADIGKMRSLEFRYDLKTTIPDASRLAPGSVISDFNLVVTGRPALKNDLYHFVMLNYRQFDFGNSYFLNAGMRHTRKLEQGKMVTQLNQADQLQSYTMFYRPENDLNLNADISRKFDAIKYSMEAQYNLRDFFQLTDGQTLKNTANTLIGGAGIRTFFKKGPNVTLGYRIEMNQYDAGFGPTSFTEHELKSALKYAFAKDFFAEADFTRSWYNSNIFDQLNTSLRYQRKNSPWGFSVIATNLLDTRFKRNNTFTNLYISDNRMFILPRMIVGKLHYKL